MIKKWKKVKTEEIYHCGKWYRVEKDKIITPGGKEGHYYVVRRQPAVAIIPIDKKKRVYLTRQHRYTANKFSLEVPGGYLDKQSNPLKIAKKELEEEMGLTSKKWKRLGVYYEALGLAEIPVYVYLAEDVKPKKNYKTDDLDKNLHQTEIYTFQQILKLVAAVKIIDSFSLAALAVAQAQGIFKNN
jgi:ADP-ribose pyrophosphatase